MPQGLAMFDAEQRLIVCNRRYAEMYGLTPEQVKPGTTRAADLRGPHCQRPLQRQRGRQVRRQLGRALRRASHRESQELARRPHHQRRAPADAERRPLSTHEDITEREKLNARLEQQNKLLKQQEEKLRAQNVQLDAALNNMLQGLAMFDAEQRLVMCNKRYAEMYGLRRSR